jgi:hypothetical protein
LEVETSTLLKTLGKKYAVTQPDPTRVEPEKRRPNPGSDQHLAGPPPRYRREVKQNGGGEQNERGGALGLCIAHGWLFCYR